MLRPRPLTLILSGLIVFACAGCGKKASPASDDAGAAAAPAPKAPPKPLTPDLQPDDGNPPPNKGLFPIDIGPITPTNPKVDPPTPKYDGPPKKPDPGPPVTIDPKSQDKKDPAKDPGPPVPTVVTPQPDPKFPPPPPKPDDKKEPVKQGSVYIWPTEIGGKDAKGYIKDMSDTDPAIRVMAIKTLPSFGPAMKKATTPDGKVTYGKALLARMNAQTETDPWVRLAAFELVALMGFEEELDAKEAVRLLGVIAEGNANLRAPAVQTLATFGSRGEASVQYLVGGPVIADPSYETRRSIAATLGLIGINEKTGPNPKALLCLANTLIHDKSAAVRLEAMQALVMLGPPHHKVMVPDPKEKGKMVEVMVPNIPEAKKYLEKVKERLAPHVPKFGETMNATGVVEPNKQVEIWARVVLMRFDPATEVNKDNLDGITKYIKGSELGPKIQGLSVLGLLGEIGSRRIDDVIRELASEDPYIVSTAVMALAQMGTAAKPAIPELEKLKGRGKDETEKKYYVMIADEAIKLIKDPPKAPDPKEKK